jgi:hypothetical protein
MGSIVYDACLPEKKPGEETVLEVELPSARHLTRFSLKDVTEWSPSGYKVGDSGDETSPKTGATLRIRMPIDYRVEDRHPMIVQASTPFMVYQASTDEMVPLTQERLRDLVEHEKQFFRLRHHLRDVADDPVTMCG